MAYLPLALDIPIAFNSCRKGPRGLEWRDDKPAEMAWIECQASAQLGCARAVLGCPRVCACLSRPLNRPGPSAAHSPPPLHECTLLPMLRALPVQDGGDPAVAASPRDVVYCMEAEAAARDSAAAPRQVAATDLRCGGVAWGSGDLALVSPAVGVLLIRVVTWRCNVTACTPICSPAPQPVRQWQGAKQCHARGPSSAMAGGQAVPCQGSKQCHTPVLVCSPSCHDGPPGAVQHGPHVWLPLLPLLQLYESWWKTRRSVTWIIAPDQPNTPKQLLFDRNYEDSYTGAVGDCQQGQTPPA
jgi:hypothetical protein